MKKTLNLALATGLAGCLSMSAFAQVAADKASNSVYIAGNEYIQVGTPPGNQTLATNGLNGGFGFEKWQRGGYGDPPANGTTLITSIPESFGMGSQQFGLRSGPGGTNGADARRRMLAPIGVGDTFRASLMAGGNGAGTLNSFGEFGIEFRSPLLSNPGRDMAVVIGEMGRNWRVQRSGGTQESTLPVVAGERIDITFRILPNDQFACTFTNPAGVCSTVTGTFISLGQSVQTAQFFCFGTDGDFYVNNLAAYEGLTPDSFSIVEGLYFGGDLDSLGRSDDNHLFVLNDEDTPNAEVRFISTCAIQPATSATFTYEIGSDRNDLAVFVETLVFGETPAWVIRDLQTSTLTDTSYTVTINGGNLEGLVSSAGSMQARIRWIPFSDLEIVDGWSERIDHFTWVLE